MPYHCLSSKVTARKDALHWSGPGLHPAPEDCISESLMVAGQLTVSRCTLYPVDACHAQARVSGHKASHPRSSRASQLAHVASSAEPTLSMCRSFHNISTSPEPRKAPCAKGYSETPRILRHSTVMHNSVDAAATSLSHVTRSAAQHPYCCIPSSAASLHAKHV